MDIETTGRPLKENALYFELNNWPRIVEIAWQKYSTDQNLTEEVSFIIYPENFEIPKEAETIHGISTGYARLNGVKLINILEKLATTLKGVEIIVAHNIDFDLPIIKSEFYRLGMQLEMASLQKICTMKSSVNYCGIETEYGFKFPSLSELFYRLFGYSLTNSHSALSDVRATAKCFWQLSNESIISHRYNEPIFSLNPNEKSFVVEHYEILTISGNLGNMIYLLIPHCHGNLMIPFMGVKNEEEIDLDLPVRVSCFTAENAHKTSFGKKLKKGENIWFARKQFNM